MINRIRPWLVLALGISTALFAVPPASAQSGVFTIELGAQPLPPTPLVNHSQTWSYRRGTNEPQADWRTTSTAGLDATWLSGPGGLGYGDALIQGQATTINNMRSNHSTLYIRREFEVTNSISAAAELRLLVDYDDGFVAYLDGAELTRANINGAAGTPVLSSAFAASSHEASCCNAPTNPPQTFMLGSVGNRLAVGTHVLSLIALNDDLASSDLHIIPDLFVAEVQSLLNNGFYTLTSSNALTLTGSNTIAGSTRVTVNADDATFNAANGTWSKTQSLVPGFNRLYIAAHDGTGNILTNLIQDVVYEVSPVTAGGTLAGNTFWTNRNEVIHVTNNVVVPDGVRLEIGLDAVMILSPGVSVTATTNGSITSVGSELTRAYFLPASSSAWGGLTANGTNSSLTIRNADVVSGQVRLLNGGTLLLEDMTIRDLPDLSREVIEVVNGASLTMRRVYMTRFAEGDSQNTPVLVEDSLLEGFLVDGMDIKATNSPLVVRRTTLRNADPNNSNADGIDFGPGAGTVENCLIYNFPDKGVSIGGASGTVIRDSLIYNCGIGISAYSSSNCVFYNMTVAACSNGVFLRDNPGPALAFATNLIVWGNTNNIIVTNTSTLGISFSDIEGTNFPGAGNISADPLFYNAAAGDYRLGPGSPALGSGFGGEDMGARFPVGGIPSAPARLAAIVSSNQILLTWDDTAANEDAVQLQRSTDRVNWQTISTPSANVTSYADSTALVDQPYYYRVRAMNSSGRSAFSNPARGIIQSPAILAGGVLASNTIWSGMVLVLSNVIVPTNITLTVEAGALVKLTNNVSVTAQAGGVIHIEGAEDNLVTLQRWNGTNNWGELRAEGSNALLVVRHADISGGQTTVYFGAAALLEDSYFHDFFQQGAPTIFNQPLILTQFAAPTTVRRCFMRNFHETLWRHGIVVVEDCVFQDTAGDAFDFDAALPGCVVRRCTFRHGTRTNIDAIDVGNDGAATSSGVLIDSCLMYDFPFDKGVSIGEGSTNTVVTNCFMYNCLWGVGVKDSSTAGLFNNTIVNCDIGFRLYNKIGGTGSGIVTNCFNNILWENTNGSIAVLDGGTMAIAYSDLWQTNWPGPGNISADPLFLNANAGDYRLATNSPARASGRNGESMGAHFPVGSVMAPSHPTVQSLTISNSIALLRFWADPERTYSVEATDDVAAGTWTRIGDIPLSSRPRMVTITNGAACEKMFYRLITPRRP
jgi:hypothetical protein